MSVLTIFADEEREFWQQQGEGGHIAEHDGEGGHVADEGGGEGGHIPEHHKQQNKIQKNIWLVFAWVIVTFKQTACYCPK